MPQFNPFPVGYQPYSPTYQYQPYQPYQPQQMSNNSWNTPSVQIPQQNPTVQQDMTPVIHMDIKQVENTDAISKNPPSIGTTGAYMTKDEKTIVFRSVYANGEYTDRVYIEQPPAPPVPVFDPKEYVRKDELEESINAIVSAQMADIGHQNKSSSSSIKRSAKKEEND